MRRLIAAAALLAACHRDAPPPSPPPAPAAPPAAAPVRSSRSRDSLARLAAELRGESLSVDAFRRFAFDELRAIHDTLTLNDWRKAHPLDSLRRYDRRTRESEGWCAIARGETQFPAGGAATREAYFYPPLPPGDLALPDDADSARLVPDRCRLGFIIVKATLDSARGDSTAAALRDAITHLLSDTAIPAGRRFESGVMAASGRRMHAGPYVVGAAWEKPARALWVFSATAIADTFNYSRSRLANEDTPELAWRRRLALRAVAAAGLDTATAAHLLALGDSASDSSAFVAGLESWLRATRTRRDANGRAAGLLFADWTLRQDFNASGLSAPDSSASPLRARLARGGARIVYDEPGESFGYEGNLLDSALAQHPTGLTGEILYTLDLDATYPKICNIGPRDVINEGERLLPSLHDPALQAFAHFTLGDAYRDQVFMADMESTAEWGPPTPPAIAARARLLAVRHYREALRLGRDLQPDRARASWREGWLLIAGLQPRGVRFLPQCE
jgi:hypothetical protein